MKILPVNRSLVSFSAVYKTEDVLRLITGYPYKNKSTDGELVKSLTGIDIYSKELSSLIPSSEDFLYSYLSIIGQCTDEIIKQHPILAKILDEFNPKLHLDEGKKSQDNWFKRQLSKLQPSIDIEPFSLNKEELEKDAETYKAILDKVL